MATLLDEANSLYNSANDNGKRYMYDIFNYSHCNPQVLHDVLLERAKYAQDKNTGSVKALQNQLYNKGLDYQLANNKVQLSSQLASQNDVDRINKYFERPDVAQAVNAGLFDKFNQENQSSLTKVSKLQVPGKAKSNRHQIHNYNQEAEAVSQGLGIYRSLSPQGRKLFNTNLSQARSNPKHFVVAKNTDFGSLKRKERSLFLSRNAIAQGNYRYGQPVPENEQQKINQYFQNRVQNSNGQNVDIVPAIQDGMLSNIIYSYDKRQQVTAAKQQQEAQTIATPKDYYNSDPDKFKQMQADGYDIYQNLSPQGRKYMSTAMNMASYNLNDFDKARHSGPDALTLNQARLRNRLQYISGLKTSQNDSHLIAGQNAMDPEEKESIDQYLDDPVTQNGLQNGKTQQYIQNQQKLDDVVPMPKDYRSKNPELYRHQLARGAVLYDKLSERGRKYMLTAAKEADYNFNDFEKARHGDPSKLTNKQLAVRQRLQRASGYRKSENGMHPIMSPNAIPKSEKTAIDKYMSNPVTQDGLRNGDTYNLLMLQNIRKRELQETREDEEQPSTLDEKAASFLANRMKNSHPYAFALGYELGGLPSHSKILYKKARHLIKHRKSIQKHKNFMKLGHKPLSKMTSKELSKWQHQHNFMDRAKAKKSVGHSRSQGPELS